LVWSIINKFVIEDISIEEATARDALLIWCKKNTAGYPGVDVRNFGSSWLNGLAWCALLNKFRPQLLDYSTLTPESTDKSVHLSNTASAWEGYRQLGITTLLDPEDVVGPLDDTSFVPDDKSVVTQVSELYHFFAADTKAQTQADKLKRIVQIQKALDALSSNYAKEAQETIDAINAATAKLEASDYAKTVLGLRGKLAETIAYSRDERPTIVERRATALRTWGALSTKAKSTGRPIPTPPAGLEPETLNEKFQALEALATRRERELSDELKATEQALIAAFDGKADALVNSVKNNRDRSQSLQGPLADQLTALNALYDETPGYLADAGQLEAPNQELVDLGLNTRAKHTIFSVKSEVEQLIAHLKHLIEQNKGAQFEAENQRRIEEYNTKALPFLDEAQAFDASLQAIEGDLVTRRTALLAKQAELSDKRAGAQVLVPVFQDLEKDGLHIDIANTPGKINGIYGGALNRIVEDLQKIYKEMVDNFDSSTSQIVAKIKDFNTKADEIQGTPIEIRDFYAKTIEDIAPVQGEIDSLDAPFKELIEFKLNFKVKLAVTDVQSEFDIVVAHVKHLLQSKQGEIILAEREARIQAYKAQAADYTAKASALEKSIQDVGAGEGTLEQKLAAYNAKKTDVTQFGQSIDALVPAYQDLEKDQLHLEIEHTPASFQSFVRDQNSHIVTLITEIDQAIAREKGLQIPEEQLAEFRETFIYFDKEGNKMLEPFQLNACLTSLGEPTDDQECAQIIRKYMKNDQAKGIDFDGYVAFMLDRFSKAETNTTTKDAFQAISGGQPVITEDQLDRWFTPEDSTYLKGKIAKNDAGVYEYGPYVDSIFA
jgi:actinin alpha